MARYYSRSERPMMQNGVGTGSRPDSSQPGGGPTTTSNGYATIPAYLGGAFPTPSLISYSPIKPARYKFTDPQQFAETYGQFNRGEIQKNFELAKGQALDQLDLELQGLQSFVPAASALKRQETSIDNIFNQQQRSQQVNTALPQAGRQLSEQGARAETYAAGRVPDSILDRGLELGIRSNAADAATSGGFGARSSVAQKGSDLMSAERRIQLSQYGEQLLGNNITQTANLFLAPTEYSDAGQQVRVTPEVGAGRLAAENLSQYNALTTMSVPQAFQGQVQQRQYVTSLRQQNKQFNASNQLAADQFNAQTQNQFGLTKFQYEVGFAGAEAGANQTAINTEIALAQQAAAQEAFSQGQSDATASQDIISGIGAVADVFSVASSLFGGGDTPDVGDGAALKSANLEPSDISTSQAGLNSFTPYTQQTAPVSSAPSVAPAAITATPRIVEGSSESAQGYTPARQSYATPELTGFSQATGISLGDNSAVTRQLVAGAQVPLNTAGIYNAPRVNTVDAGFNFRGAPVFTQPSSAANRNPLAGDALVASSAALVDSLDASANMKEVLAGLGATPEQLATLDATYTSDDRAFINEALKGTGIKWEDANGNNRATAAAFTAYNIKENWANMSEGQKSEAIASLRLQNKTLANGKTIQQQEVKSTAIPGYEPVTVEKSINYMKQGGNPYGVTKKWDQYSDLAKITTGSKNADAVLSYAKANKIDGKGPEGYVNAPLRKEDMLRGNYQAAPGLGVGAIVTSNNEMPQDYVAVGRDRNNKIVAVPKGLERTMPNAQKLQLLDTKGIETVASRWQSVPEKRNTSYGGSALVAKLYADFDANPQVAASAAALSMFRNVLG